MDFINSLANKRRVKTELGYSTTCYSSMFSGVHPNKFYILGIGSKINDYPKRLTVSEEKKIIAGIINHEQDTVTYQIEITIDGVKDNDVRPIILDHGEKWKETMGFTPHNVGDNQRVDFWLQKKGKVEPNFEPLRFRLDVTQ